MRYRNFRVLGLSVALIGVALRTATAQSPDEQAAYVALIYTPVAGLPPLPPVSDSLGRGNASGVTLLGRLGHMSRGNGLSLNAFGVGVEVPTGRMRLGATLAYMSAGCGQGWEGDSDCAGDIMLGGSARTLLTRRTLGASAPAQNGQKGQKGRATASPSRTSNGATLLVGFDGNIGYSPRQGQTAMALGAGIPTALVLQSGTVRITPFITPGVGYGRLSHIAYEEDESATSHGTAVLMIGGGVGLEFGTSGIGVNAGFQRVLKGYGGTTQLGIGMSWQGLTSVP